MNVADNWQHNWQHTGNHRLEQRCYAKRISNDYENFGSRFNETARDDGGGGIEHLSAVSCSTCNTPNVPPVTGYNTGFAAVCELPT